MARPPTTKIADRCQTCGRSRADGHTHRDGCVVTSEVFVEVVRGFVRRWNLERPQPGGQFYLEGEPPVRALAWLSAEAAVPEGTLEALLDVGPRARPLLELRIADAIAVALDQPDLLYDPRVVVYRNPQVRKNAACFDGDGTLRPFPPCCAGSSRPLATAA